MKTIIVFTLVPMNDDYLKRYGFQFFKDNNIDQVYLNLCELVYGHEKTQLVGYGNLGACPGVNEQGVSSYRGLFSILKNYGDDAVVYMNITYPASVLAILALLKIPYIDGSLWGGVQTVDWVTTGESWFHRNLSRLRRAFVELPRMVKGRCTSYLCQVIRKIHPPHLVLVSSLAEYNKSRNTRKLLNHTFDYDRYLVNQKMTRPRYIPEEEYYVLLPNHAWMVHDYIILDAQNDCCMTKDRYSILINSTLDKLEQLTGTKILVAGYPNAAWSEDVYVGREFLIGTETEQLVKYSAGVITHFSGAINFAVLHNKPICLFTFSDFDPDRRFMRPLESYSHALGIPVNYLDSEPDIRQLVADGLFKTPMAYENYIDKFICSKDLATVDGHTFWERVLRYLV